MLALVVSAELHAGPMFDCWILSLFLLGVSFLRRQQTRVSTGDTSPSEAIIPWRSWWSHINISSAAPYCRQTHRLSVSPHCRDVFQAPVWDPGEMNAWRDLASLLRRDLRVYHAYELPPSVLPRCQAIF